MWFKRSALYYWSIFLWILELAFVNSSNISLEAFLFILRINPNFLSLKSTKSSKPFVKIIRLGNVILRKFVIWCVKIFSVFN